MAENTERKPGFWRLVRRQACADWHALVSGRLAWALITVPLSFVFGTLVGGRMTPVQHIVVAGVIGAVLSHLAAALLLWLWYLLRAPGKVWAADQAALAELRGRLDATRGLKLLPYKAEEYQQVGFSPYGPHTVVMGRVSVRIENHDANPTTILHLRLRVNEPTTGVEVKPLDLDRQPFDELLPREDGLRDIGIGGRSIIEREVVLHDYFPLDVLRWRREGKAAQMITVCATALGMDESSTLLGEEFFAPIEVELKPPADPRPPTASGQVPPSSPESSG
jgi:hypothetical protein